MITNMVALSAADAAATPVVHTYTPASRVAENTARWLDKDHNNGVAIGYKSVSYTVKEPSNPGGVYRQKVAFAVPLVDFSVATKPTLLGTARANVEFIFPDIMNDQQRKDVVTEFHQLLFRSEADKLGDNIVAQSLPY